LVEPENRSSAIYTEARGRVVLRNPDTGSWIIWAHETRADGFPAIHSRAYLSGTTTSSVDSYASGWGKAALGVPDGRRTFDFNVDGLAHVGMLPDMIADFQAMGLSEDDLEPLLDSADGYLRMWEKA
jgi:hypothetical protein